MEYKDKVATVEEIEATLRLHAKYQVDTIAEEDKKDGFVTTPFTKEELQALIEQEQGLFIAKEGEEVVAYVMAASWQFWSKWAMFRHMIEDLQNLAYKGEKLSVENSYQYGVLSALTNATEVRKYCQISSTLHANRWQNATLYLSLS